MWRTKYTRSERKITWNLPTAASKSLTWKDYLSCREWSRGIVSQLAMLVSFAQSVAPYESNHHSTTWNSRTCKARRSWSSPNTLILEIPAQGCPKWREVERRSLCSLGRCKVQRASLPTPLSVSIAATTKKKGKGRVQSHSCCRSQELRKKLNSFRSHCLCPRKNKRMPIWRLTK